MSKLQVSIQIAGEQDKEVLGAVAARIQSALAEERTFENPAAVPIKGTRGVAEFAAIIAVAASITVDLEKGLEALEGVINRLQNLLGEPKEKSEQILANLKPNDIMVNVDGSLVPLNKLTQEHMAWLASR